MATSDTFYVYEHWRLTAMNAFTWEKVRVVVRIKCVTATAFILPSCKKFREMGLP